MATLGKKLIILRRQSQLTQVEIADILEISQNTYSKWEADKCKPSAKNLINISKYYNIDVIMLLDEKENNTSIFQNQSSRTVMEQVKKMQERISKLLESLSDKITLLL